MTPATKVSEPIRTRRLQTTAYHEAGHAVAAWRKNLKFKQVSIQPDAEAGSLGHVLYGFPKWFRPDIDQSDRTLLHAERHIITDFAGQLAEAKFRGRRLRYGMESDNQRAVDFALRLCGSPETSEAYLHYCFLSSRDLVDANWGAIEAVAAALLKQRTLSLGDVIEVVLPGSAALRASLKRAKAKRKGA